MYLFMQKLKEFSFEFNNLLRVRNAFENCISLYSYWGNALYGEYTSCCHIHFIDQSFYWSLIIGSYTHNCVERDRVCTHTQRERERWMRLKHNMIYLCACLTGMIAFSLYSTWYTHSDRLHIIYDILFKSERPSIRWWIDILVWFDFFPILKRRKRQTVTLGNQIVSFFFPLKFLVSYSKDDDEERNN